MNVIGGGLVIIIAYAGSSGAAIQNALLTEANNEILTESSDYLQVETV